MTKKKRLFAALLAVAVIFVVLFSAFFIAENANHYCVGDDCSICSQVTVCENVLRTIGSAAVTALVAVFFGGFVSFLTAFFKKTAYSTSLVTLKVKLSN